MKTISLPINDFQINAEGNLVIICPPSKENAKGAYVMNAAQTARILQRSGVPSVYAMKHVASLANGTNKFTFVAEECKAGDTWTNEKSGETGTYEKDWTKYSNHSVELGFAAKMKLAEASLANAFATPQFPVATPKVAAATVAETVVSTDGDNVPNV